MKYKWHIQEVTPRTLSFGAAAVVRCKRTLASTAAVSTTDDDDKYPSFLRWVSYRTLDADVVTSAMLVTQPMGLELMFEPDFGEVSRSGA